MKSLKRLLCFVVAMTAMTIGAFAQDTYSVVGSWQIVNGGNWDTTGTLDEMTLNTETGLYELEIQWRELTAGETYGFKVIKNHDYANGEWPSSDWVVGSGQFSETAYYNLKYTFNLDTREVGFTATKVRDIWMVAGSATGSDQGGDPDVIFGTSWSLSNTGNDMSDNGDGTWTLIKQGVSLNAGTVKYKMVRGRSWSLAYPSDNNAVLSIPSNGVYDLKFTLNTNVSPYEVSAAIMTPKALWIPDAPEGGTLIFVYDGNAYVAGNSYQSSYDGRTYTIGAVYTVEDRAYRTSEIRSSMKKAIFDFSFQNCHLTDMSEWFYKCGALTTVTGLSNINTYNVTDMHDMFAECESLTSVDLRYFYTPNVTNMSSMFDGCENLVTLNLQTFNTSNVQNMKAMFSGCEKLERIYIGDDWSTQNVTYANEMFYGCVALVGSGASYTAGNDGLAYANADPGTGYLFRALDPKALWLEDCSTLVFVYDLVNYTEGTDTYAIEGTNYTITKVYPFSEDVYNTPWRTNDMEITDGSGDWRGYKPTTVLFDTSFALARPVYTHGWFANFRSLTSIVNIGNLNTSAVTDMGGMFKDCQSLQTLDLSSFNTANVTNMSEMFEDCRSLQTIDVSNFNTANVTEMRFMFADCTSLRSITGLNYFNTANVIDMRRMFDECVRLSAIDVSSFNTAKVTDMACMFERCESLTSLNVSNFNTANVIDMYGMFHDCDGLTTIDLSNFNTAKATDMSYMFRSCEELEYIIGLDYTNTLNTNFVTSNVTNMRQMFEDCGKLVELNVSNFDTGNVTNMYSMFDSCDELEVLDVSNFDTSKCTDMNKMFFLCEGVKSIDVSGFDTRRVTDMRNLFAGCTNLTGIKFGQNFSFASIAEPRNKSNLFFDDYMLRYVDFKDCPVGLFQSGDNFDRSYTMGNYTTYDLVKVQEDMYNMLGIPILPTMDDYLRLLASVSAFISQFDNGVSGDNVATIFFQSYTPATVGVFTRLPETTVVYLPSGNNAVTTETNVVYTDPNDNKLKCKEYNSIDLKNFYNVMSILDPNEEEYVPIHIEVELPYAFYTNKAEYSRTMNNTYGSVVLPYAFTTNSDIQAYTLDEQNGDALTFKDAVTVAAHTPFAFKKLGDAEFIMEDSNFGIEVKATRDTAVDQAGPYTVATNLSGWTAIGYYENQFVDKTSGTYYYIASDKVYKATGTGNLTLYPHRVIFQTTDSSAKMFGIETVSGDEVITAIERADVEKTVHEAEGIYDMQGRQQNGLRKGVNIVRMSDGTTKKVIIR